MKIEPCPFCGSSDANIGRTSESVSLFWVHCRTCYCDGPAKETVEQATDAHNRLSRIVRAAEMLAKVLPEKWQQDILIRWLDGYDMIKGTTSKEIQTVMGELFGKAGDLKEAVEGGRADG